MIMKISSNFAGLVVGMAAFASAGDAKAQPFHHEFGELREYHLHWLAVCPDRFVPDSTSDYERQCWASTFSGINGNFSGDFPGNRLTVGRDRQNGKIKITFVMVGEDMVDRSRRIGLTFSNGQQNHYTFGNGIITNGNVVNEFTFSNYEETLKVLEQMKARSHMLINIPLKSGDALETQFSLMGLRRAIAFTEKYAKPEN